MGRVASLEADPDLADIDRLARRYSGKDYRVRDHRRVSAWVEVEHWYGWNLD